MELSITNWNRFKAEWGALRGYINKMDRNRDAMDLVRAVDKAVLVLEADSKRTSR